MNVLRENKINPYIEKNQEFCNLFTLFIADIDFMLQDCLMTIQLLIEQTCCFKHLLNAIIVYNKTCYLKSFLIAKCSIIVRKYSSTGSMSKFEQYCIVKKFYIF